METSRKAPSHFRAGLLGGVILAGLGALLLGPAGDSFGRLSYDAPFWRRSSPPVLDLVLVFVDDAALEKFGRMPDETLDRRAQIRLLQRLIDDGARLVYYDFIFDISYQDSAVDEEFARTIRQHGNVVLGAGYNQTREGDVGPNTVLTEVRAPTLVLRRAAKSWGLLDFNPVDPDGAVRQIYQGTDYDTNADWIVAQILGAPVTKDPAQRQSERWLNYYGPPSAGAISYRSLEAALTPGALPAGYFRDKIVIVCPRSTVEGIGINKDEYRTPFSRFGYRTSPGAEIHATALINLLHNDWLTRMPARWQLFLVIFIGLGAALWLSALRPWHAAWVAGVCMLAVVVFAFYLQWTHHVWWSWMIPVAAQIPFAFIWSVGVHYVLEVRKRLRVHRALAVYVSPHIAHQIAESNFNLAPGGKVVDATIMFTDLEGFTTISESLDTHEVSSLLTTYFNQTTRTILERRGTISKFIGDSVMAIWGAPLDDPQQAENAVITAIEMVQAGRQQIAGRRLRTRVGINSGRTLAGNLGSDVRFDYTAIGDAVNSASRLEGLNKYLSTEILIADTTQRQLSNRIRTRYAGRFLLAGKFEPIIVHEVLGLADQFTDQTGWVAKFDQAMAAFAKREFKEAETLFGQVMQLRGGTDGPSGFYLEQIRNTAQTLRPEDPWDGSVHISSK